MSGTVLFYMWEPFRQRLIERHLFYVEQARNRVLSQFDDIEAEADKVAEDRLKQSEALFNPDYHDPEAFYDAATEAGYEFYDLISDMHDQTRLSVVAGMFHEWDKQLRDWLVREISHWCGGDHVRSKVWSVKFRHLVDFIEGLGWKIRTTDYFSQLDACRLVVNSYKHGYGDSLKELHDQFPEFIASPLKGSGGVFEDLNWSDYQYIKVTDAHLQSFSDAIVAFWRAVPERIYNSEGIDVPKWFEKALAKQSAAQ